MSAPKPAHSAADAALRRYQRLGLLLVAAVFGGCMAWGAIAQIAGAVTAPAIVTVESYAKKVQHLEGGIVAEVRVKNGDRVKEGDVLVRLDETDTRASLGIVNAQLVEYSARRARLVVERDGGTGLKLPESYADQHDPEGARTIWEGQAKLLESRLAGRSGKKAQLEERAKAFGEAIEGLKAQQSAKERQIAFVGKELTSVKTLQKQQLVAEPRVLALEREQARLEGERGQFVAEIARTQVQIGETRLQLLEIDQTFTSEVLAELREVELRLTEAAEKVSALNAKLRRMSIKSPRNGVAYKVATNTIGGVVQSGEAIMEVVPEEDTLVLDGRIETGQIDQVKEQQPAVIRFSAFNQRTTPELRGVVTQVSPGAQQDNPQLPAYYLVRVEVPESEIAKLGDQKLRPGMPAEIFIQTGERTALSYLVKPLTDQIKRAMNER
jgi:HlyD family secretion protein